MGAQPHFPPGARVEIRDCVWIIRRSDRLGEGKYQLTVDGISELVQGKTAKFLTELENVRVLDPAETTLEVDTSPQFEKSRLFIESQLRQVTPADGKIHIGHKAAMDPVPYQLDPALQALAQPRQRILIADAVGLGKTLEAGILTSELIRRGRGKRILVLTLKSMMTQFQKEFWNRFTIPLTRLDSAGLQRVRNNIPGTHNPFYYYDKSIISIDTLKQDNEFRRHLEQAHWDIIIIDEVHNVAERSQSSGSSSQRAKLAQLLAQRSDTLIMLSATPHDGKARSFASLINMLDATAISDPDNYVKDDFSDKGLVIRRFKKDIRDQVDSEFKERTTQDLKFAASPEEEAAYDALLNVPFTFGGEHKGDKHSQLLRIGLQKAIFSSPAAAIKSTEQRLKKLTNKEIRSEDEQAEINALESLKLALQNITPANYSKYSHLLKLLKSKDYGWNKSNPEDRLVIFSERIETLRWLEQQLSADLKLTEAQITQLHGGMSDIEQQAIVESFGKTDSKLRVLLCSDVASEGINLHYQAHRLIHFDLPWSLMVFQQRNGRVDRYGQTEQPIISYLITESANDTIRGDIRILEILKEKDEQAQSNIGDPAAFMGLYDSAEEEKKTSEVMAEGLAPETFSQQLNDAVAADEGEDIFAMFLADTAEDASGVSRHSEEQASSYEVSGPTIDAYSLYSSEYAFVESALTALNREQKVVEWRAGNHIDLHAPDDLIQRFKYLPSEIRPQDNRFVLTQDKATYEAEIKRARQDETAWPKLHYLWPMHPVVDWLQSRINALVARHSAPVMQLADDLAPGEAVFLVSGLIPNKKSHPVIWRWFAVHCQNGQVQNIEDATTWLKRIDLSKRRPNRAGEQANQLEQLNQLRKPVIDLVQQHMVQAQQQYNLEHADELVAKLKALRALEAKQVQQLELDLQSSNQEAHFKAARKEKREQEIHSAFAEYMQWVEDTMNIEEHAYCQIIAVASAE